MSNILQPSMEGISVINSHKQGIKKAWMLLVWSLILESLVLWEDLTVTLDRFASVENNVVRSITFCIRRLYIAEWMKNANLPTFRHFVFFFLVMLDTTRSKFTRVMGKKNLHGCIIRSYENWIYRCSRVHPAVNWTSVNCLIDTLTVADYRALGNQRQLSSVFLTFWCWTASLEMTLWVLIIGFMLYHTRSHVSSKSV